MVDKGLEVGDGGAVEFAIFGGQALLPLDSSDR